MQIELPNIEPKKNRHLLKIPNFDYFADNLHERLHAILYHYEAWDSRFMLITTLYDRDPERIKKRQEEYPDDLDTMRYAAIARQRHILTHKDDPEYYIKSLRQNGKKWNAAEKEKWVAERDINWNFLDNKLMDSHTENIDSVAFYYNVTWNDTTINQIKAKSLKEYFQKIDNDFKKNEYPIITDYFDISIDKYIGIPLMCFGLFQGIVWIIFKAVDKQGKRIQMSRQRIVRIMKYFQVEYENITLDWDTNIESLAEKSSISGLMFRTLKNNPIQQAAGQEKYYEISNYYHIERIKQSDNVVAKYRESHAKTATIATLLDSYAHNISAHSLTALNWWFRERAEYLDESHGGRTIIETLGRDNNPLILHYKAIQTKAREVYKARMEEILNTSLAYTLNALAPYLETAEAQQKLNNAFQDTKNQLADITIKQPSRSLSKELAPLFKFLLEKGAFWSGITRQTNISGKVSSLYNILWFDFVNNPLYLGTIANTEQVMKLHIHISFYEQKEESIPGKSNLYNRKRLLKNEEGQLLSGCFATIDMQQLDFDTVEEGESVFVQKGAAYGILEAQLRKTKAFFPGGVVGKHAFFTLIENEIRNVKHFREEALDEIRKNGLNLHLSIHQRPVYQESVIPGKKPELLKIGVWLGHTISDISSKLLLERIINLDKDIITDETLQPRLGGNQQDKLCAAMLLNKTFDKAQDKGSPLGKIYYPWLKTVSADYHENPDYVDEFEVSRRNYEKLGEKRVIKAFKQKASDKGYLKKYFHLWQGDDVVELDTAIVKDEKGEYPKIAGLEEYARYRFMHLSGEALQDKPYYQHQGVLRILESDHKPENLDHAYQQWLRLWLRKQDTVVTLKEGSTDVARLWLLGGEVGFESYDDIQYASPEHEGKLSSAPNKISLTYAHGLKLTAESHQLNIRSHGELVRQFGGGKFPDKIANMSKVATCELLEVLATRICLFDRRVYNRLVDGHSAQVNLQKARLDYFRNSLCLSMYDEEHAHWAAQKARGFHQYHYVLLHLSFIESIFKPEKAGEKYKEKDIIAFIKDEILQGKTPDEMGDTFRIVITTGRGRMEWWDTLQEYPDFARIVTFRSIETILNGIENALQIADDVDLKYHLTKLLLGS